MNEAYQRILSLRAIRQFAPTPISDDDLTAILEAARWTGSAKNSQLWSFIVVSNATQKARLVECGRFMTPVENAPMALVIVQEPGGYEFDSGRVAQNVMLAADAIGVASCPVTLHDEDCTRRVLGIPNGARARYAIALGYRDETSGPAAWGGRKPLSDLVNRDRYDEG